ncbi:hypothetical protein pb186bvf_009773 [Paramecium bursaria]
MSKYNKQRDSTGDSHKDYTFKNIKLFQIIVMKWLLEFSFNLLIDEWKKQKLQIRAINSGFTENNQEAISNFNNNQYGMLFLQN